MQPGEIDIIFIPDAAVGREVSHELLLIRSRCLLLSQYGKSNMTKMFYQESRCDKDVLSALARLKRERTRPSFVHLRDDAPSALQFAPQLRGLDHLHGTIVLKRPKEH